MILGGALGNLVDRFFRSPGPLRGHVVDFLSVGWWPVFNVADPAVVGGAILLVVLSLFGFDFDTAGRRQPDSASRTETETETEAEAEAESTLATEPAKQPLPEPVADDQPGAST